MIPLKLQIYSISFYILFQLIRAIMRCITRIIIRYTMRSENCFKAGKVWQMYHMTKCIDALACNLDTGLHYLFKRLYNVSEVDLLHLTQHLDSMINFEQCSLKYNDLRSYTCPNDGRELNLGVGKESSLKASLWNQHSSKSNFTLNEEGMHKCVLRNSIITQYKHALFEHSISSWYYF